VQLTNTNRSRAYPQHKATQHQRFASGFQGITPE
jgi:hypothetical protein